MKIDRLPLADGPAAHGQVVQRTSGVDFDHLVAMLGAEIAGQALGNGSLVGKVFAIDDEDIAAAMSGGAERFGQGGPFAAPPIQPRKKRGQKLAEALTQQRTRGKQIESSHQPLHKRGLQLLSASEDGREGWRRCERCKRMVTAT